MMENTDRYTRVAMLLHWLVALLIGVNVGVGWLAHALPDAAIRPAINLHKSIGLTVGGLVVLRILWRLTHRPPPMPASYPGVERAGAHAAHVGLYVLIFAIPLSGYIHDSAFAHAAQHPLTLFGLVTIPRVPAIVALDPAAKAHVHAVFFAAHVWLNYALYAVLALHVAGALTPQFVAREPEVRGIFSCDQGAAGDPLGPRAPDPFAKGF